ncbi:nicotinate-nucleotide--dimethylbenzimidazole phosphoribosyltransferase [Williamsia serinedens]|uniref:Nicotinate-nucleotide--dimethylbenzimidazole phosphoribosyltransferase n=1 Tax=Williamsia serinedens TaxID=391736 RepID=A0ABT1H9T3_9NOCA|nr:nicotinate-nucleotide--dimethylbenzimidazole phosphoribosyltransferase [Williamsia serinedens]MCP2162578.1 adenosylcobinamide kinase /nicotinate-nucleotide-dimethylbenzimidazole phosphoribosyltransferase /adenosylcobinamide-phosphate guanylyltransferase [Williamsia serinedens]
MRTLVLGGIRSGKSALAEDLIRESGHAVRYVATASLPPTGDPDFAARIDAHRRRRPAGWSVVEDDDVATVLRDDADSPTLVDDLGNWVSSHLDRLGGWEDPDVDLTDRVADLAAAVAAHRGDLVLVSPEVGLSLVAPVPSGRRFQDELGRVNTAVAAVCDRVLLVVAGRVLELDAPVGAGAGGVASSRPEPTPAVPPAPAPAPANAPTAAETPPAPPAPPLTPSVGAHRGAPDEFDVVASPDAVVAEEARTRQRSLTKPAGSLGRLEDLSIWAASCQGVCPPAPFADPVVVVFAGDHGVARAGVSAYPPEVTAQMVANIAAGGAAVSVLAQRVDARVVVEDIAVDADTDPAHCAHKVRRGSGDLRVEDALSADEVRTALAAGRAIADDLVDSGVDLLIAGDLGIGNTTPAAVLVGTLTGTEPVVVVGRGTGIDDHGWIRKTAAIRDGMRRARKVSRSPVDLLAAVAGADIAAMAGFLAQAALRRTPVILDGVVVTAAALVAEDLAPGAVRWWLAGHRSAEPAHTIALRQLDLDPVVEFGMRLGEGSGALTALPVVQAAVATLASMATFDDAGVSTRDEVDATEPV